MFLALLGFLETAGNSWKTTSGNSWKHLETSGITWELPKTLQFLVFLALLGFLETPGNSWKQLLETPGNIWKHLT